MTEDELRAIAEGTDRVYEKRVAPLQDELKLLRAEVEEMRANQAEYDRILGIERRHLHDVAYDGLASGDQGVVWDDFEFDQSVPPNIAKKMIDRNYGGR